ncbi:amyloid-beta A4 precursor protein-binding family A member 3 isoform X2 [Stegostoma tigrinum]|uniref:amyloid-beta A4 precursor protein-binding family A member 3 isoform X2 n=1 Tax=Stegostoma tigrinum TaxID=3053191 RepID=UPI00287041F1|nr:amyloid-beta A4 precursor protein-binding family A member 3 isoform X2 [Stegostoma tigrinum]
MDGVRMDDQELENGEVKVESVHAEVDKDVSLKNRCSWDANGETLEEDFHGDERCALLSKDVTEKDNFVDLMELENTLSEGGSASVNLSDLTTDSENNLIRNGVIDLSSETDNVEKTSDLQDDDHCQIKLLLSQLHMYEQGTVTLGSKAKLVDGYSLESDSKLITCAESDSLTSDNRQLFNTINHQDVLTEMSPEPLMSTERPRRYEMKDLLHHGGELSHAPEGAVKNNTTSREVSSGNVFGQSVENTDRKLQHQQAADLCAGSFGANDDSSSLDCEPLYRLKKDWRREGEALSLAIKELKEEVENISKSFLPEDDVEHTDMPSRAACHTESSIREHDSQPRKKFSYPAFKEVSGPCDSEDLLDGIIFTASYLGSTQLFSDKNPSTNVRMSQAQEAVGRIKAPEGESQPMTAVDLFISTQRIKVLNAETQEALMDHPLQTISYIADIGTTIVFMARRRMPRKLPDQETRNSPAGKREYKMICHVFESEDASLIAQAIGQAFTVAYQQFLNANGINPADLSPNEYNDLLDTEFYNGDLVHFSKSENSKEVHIEKAKGEILGLVIVESGWGSILPTVVIANLMHGGPTERSGELNIGDQIISVNGTSLVGLPLTTCQGIIKDLKYQSEVTLSIVRCPPVTTAIIKRPDQKHQLGFSVQDGIIYSLMRGGIAERGGIRVGHRIIEINGQSVVATPHDKIVQRLSNATGEIHIKTMPAATYRLLTGQEQPIYI